MGDVCSPTHTTETPWIKFITLARLNSIFATDLLSVAWILQI